MPPNMENDSEVQTSSTSADEAASQPAAEPINWEERAQKAERLLSDIKETAGVSSVKDVKEKLKPKPLTQESRQENVSQEDIDSAHLAARGFSDEEIEKMKPLAKAYGKRLKDIHTNLDVQYLIEKHRAQAKQADATPTPSSRPQALSGGNQKDWKTMTPDERKQGFEAHKQALIKSRGKN